MPPRRRGFHDKACCWTIFDEQGTTSNLNLLITGGAGFIGTHLSRALLQRGHSVTVLDSFSVQIHGSNKELPSDLRDNVRLVRGDVRDVARSRRGEASLVVCNPPYTAPGRGQVRPTEATARCGELAGFVHAARQVAGKRARVCFVYRAQELGALLASLAEEGLHSKRMRFVHGTAESPARIVLVEAQAGRPGGLFVMPPLIEREANGYTREMESLLARE